MPSPEKDGIVRPILIRDSLGERTRNPVPKYTTRRLRPDKVLEPYKPPFGMCITHGPSQQERPAVPSPRYTIGCERNWLVLLLVLLYGTCIQVGGRQEVDLQ